MGLRCSSQLADVAFVRASESCGVVLLSNAAKEKYGIISHSRCHDNLLFILRPDWDRVSSLEHRVIHCLKPYVGTR